MRVLHICYSDSQGGGAIGAQRLHSAMVAAGVHSNMLVLNKHTTEPNTISARTGKLNRRLRRWSAWRERILELHRPQNQVIRSLNIFPTGLDEVINASSADIVQMHWIGNNTISIAEIARIRKPLFWKLPDMWAFSGAEHYLKPGEPLRYRDGYRRSNRPRGDAGVDLNRWLWLYKQWAWRDLDLTVVTPSHWLGRKVRDSVLFRDLPVRVIANPIDLKVYAPMDRAAVRRELGLPPDATMVIFGTFGAVRDTRKGFQHLLDALKHLRTLDGCDRIQFLVFGAEHTGAQVIEGFTVHQFAATHDEAEVVRYYNCGDAFVLPSELDNLPNVITEAMACAVPCVAFRVGGLTDQIDHRENGYLADPYNAEDLARGIAWVLDQDRATIGGAARRKVERDAEPRARVMDYLRMYEQKLTGSPVPAPAAAGARPAAAEDASRAQAVARKDRVVLLEPSVFRPDDTSHNYQALLACSDVFARNGCAVDWVVNREANVQNPHGSVHGSFDYSIYDDFRRTRDVARLDATSAAAGTVPQSDAEAIRAPGARVFDYLGPLLDGLDLGCADAVVVPTADRFLVEAMLMWALLRGRAMSASIHIVFMYEQADWMTGRYPYGNMIRRLRNSGLLNRKVFLYTETRRHANALEKLVDAPVGTFPFPVALAEVEQALEATAESGATFTIGVIGRGRRDKGFGLLPDIVEKFNEHYAGTKPVRFVIQDARAVDDLVEASKRLRALANVDLRPEQIAEAEYVNLLKTCDALLLPYDRNVYALRGSAVIRQGMAYARPVICTESTSLAEAIIADNGLTGRDAQTFAAALIAVVNNYPMYRAGALAAARKYRRWMLDNAILCNARLHPLVQGRVTLFAGVVNEVTPPLEMVQQVSRVARAVDTVVCWYIHGGNAPATPETRAALQDLYFEASHPWLAESISMFSAEVPAYLRALLGAGCVERIIAADTISAERLRIALGDQAAGLKVEVFSEVAPALFDASLDRRMALVSRQSINRSLGGNLRSHLRDFLRRHPRLYGFAIELRQQLALLALRLRARRRGSRGRNQS